MVESITLHIPTALYDRLKRRAEQAQHSVEAELLEVAIAATTDSELPASLNEALAQLALLDDAALWRVARSRFPLESAHQLEALNRKRQAEGLTRAENVTADSLLRNYERSMLVRAQAAALLKERGYDTSGLLTEA